MIDIGLKCWSFIAPHKGPLTYVTFLMTCSLWMFHTSLVFFTCLQLFSILMPMHVALHTTTSKASLFLATTIASSLTLHYSSCFASHNFLCCWNTMEKVFGIPSYNELEQEMQWEDNYKRIRILAIFLQVSKFHNIVMTLFDSFNFVHSILVHISRFLKLYIYGYFHGTVYTNNCHTLIIFTTSHFVCGVLRYLEKILWLKCAIEGG